MLSMSRLYADYNFLQCSSYNVAVIEHHLNQNGGLLGTWTTRPMANLDLVQLGPWTTRTVDTSDRGLLGP
jgi:hypothetical protein